jgi:hypothetical protein
VAHGQHAEAAELFGGVEDDRRESGSKMMKILNFVDAKSL